MGLNSAFKALIYLPITLFWQTLNYKLRP